MTQPPPGNGDGNGNGLFWKIYAAAHAEVVRELDTFERRLGEQFTAVRERLTAVERKSSELIEERLRTLENDSNVLSRAEVPKRLRELEDSVRSGQTAMRVLAIVFSAAVTILGVLIQLSH